MPNNYQLIAIDTSEDILSLLKETGAEPDFGNLFYSSDYSQLRWSSKKSTPEFIRINGSKVGQYLGAYGYSENTAKNPPLVASGHVVFAWHDDVVNLVHKLSFGLIEVMARSFIKEPNIGKARQAAKDFFVAADPENKNGHRTVRLTPVFYNDTDAPIPLYIAKTQTFRLGEENKIQYGRPFAFSGDHNSPRLASEL